MRGLSRRAIRIGAFNQATGERLQNLQELARLTISPTNDAVKAIEREFLREYARAYFQTCRDAIRAADPNHLVLGCRFAGYAPAEVIEGMAGLIDVVSFNNYGDLPPTEQLRKLHKSQANRSPSPNSLSKRAIPACRTREGLADRWPHSKIAPAISTVT